MRLGILRNPASTLNRSRPAPELPAGSILAETTLNGDYGAALARIRAGGADMIVIDGGDGTVGKVVSSLPGVYGAAPPPLAIVPNGNTNLIARKVGRVAGADALTRLARATPGEIAAHCRTVPVLRIELPGSAHGPFAGFIAGWGAYASATRIAAHEIAARHDAQVLRAVFATLRRSLAGTDAAMLREGITAKFHAEGHEIITGPRFVGIVTTLTGPLIAGLQPFWGEGTGAIRWLDILSPPRRLVLAAPFVAFGRSPRWMAKAGYRSGRSPRIAVQLSRDFVLDGEIITVEPETDLRISADDQATFVGF